MAVLIATGTDMASDRLASFGDLFDTDYGKRLVGEAGVVIAVIALTLSTASSRVPALSRLREQALERPDDAELAAAIRRKAARSGIVSALNLVATLAILVLAARLVTG